MMMMVVFLYLTSEECLSLNDDRSQFSVILLVDSLG